MHPQTGDQAGMKKIPPTHPIAAEELILVIHRMLSFLKFLTYPPKLLTVEQSPQDIG